MRKIILFFMLFVAITFGQSKKVKSVTLKSDRLVTINDTYNKQVYKTESLLLIEPKKITDKTANISWDVDMIDMKTDGNLLYTVYDGTSNFGEECILRLYQLNAEPGILLIQYHGYIIYYELYDSIPNY
jgi:hypothetical protein